ncbi:prepilin peptidase [Clostridium sp.]|uniref:prepilin peptidase n=1 Tax=Clostridium sp. TaxID=1506 RepID=UPI003995A065
MTFIVFIYGIVIGSFLNVCIYRIPAERSIVRPASSCGSCGTTLKWKDLIPIFSYLSLGGKCRYCKEKVSMRYPLVEFMTGALVTLLYLRYGLTYSFFKFSLLTIVLIVIALIDFDTTDVYSMTTIPFIFLMIVFILVENRGISVGLLEYIKNVIRGCSGGIVGTLVIGVICYLTGAMGEGDIEIATLIGLVIGFKLTIFMILASFIIGGIYGGALIISKKKSRNDYIAFGPSLAMAAYLSMIIGNNIISKYLLNF